MSELQIGLIGLGGVAVVAVVAYNTWQEYKQRKLAEQLLQVPAADVLLDAENAGETGAAPARPEAPVDLPQSAEVSRGASGRAQRIEPVLSFAEEPQEPVLSFAEEPQEPVLSFAEEPQEPVLSFAEEPQEPVPAASARLPVGAEPAHAPRTGPAAVRAPDDKDAAHGIEPVHLLSPVIDYVAAFEAVEPAPAGQILEAQREALARIRKPIHWIGYNERTREWETVVNDGESEYRRIRVGLQLVDRRGPVADHELSAFHIAMHDLGDVLMAIADLPPRQAALDTAARLDAFCASVDIQIGINVVSGAQVFLGTKLRALAESAGMVIDSDGRFVRCDDDGQVLYVLVNQEASGFSVESMKTLSTHGVTFLLDVPRVAHGERVFNQMLDLARRFADVLHGALVDDNRRPLSETALEPIRRQVGQYQAMMAERSLPAGGPLAQRMFS